jgi:hypothetical protein
MNTTPLEDQFRSVQELNRAFLSLLQQRARAPRPPPDPLGSVPSSSLHAASSALLDAAAEFPGALFRVRLEACEGTALCSPRAPGSIEETEYHLGSSILHAVRHSSRQNAYHAQVLFGLERAEVERFRGLTLDDLRRLAGQPGLLVCAHADRPWFWQGLLGPSRPESRRLYTLMALQPAAPRGWPIRRPPHPAR